MKKNLYLLFLVLLVAGAFLAGYRSNRQASPPAKPAFGDSGDDLGDHPPGTVRVSPEKQQLIGVRVDLVEQKGITHRIRVVGRVAADENRIHRVVAPTEGWLVDVEGGTTGSLVTKDQLLCKIASRDIFNRDLISGQQAFFLALAAWDRKKAENAPAEQVEAAAQQVLVAERNLLAIGMGEAQIKELARTRKPDRDIEIRAPAAGFVLTRNVTPGLRFDRNQELYRIADLSRVWILADVYEEEAEYFKPGLQARIKAVNLRSSYTARVSNVPPLFDAASRTLKVRLEVDNSGFALKPDMFVDVELPVKMPPALTVPTDALLDSGLRQTVFVDRGHGFFEPRPVKTGWRLGGRVEILGGLSAGERIVTAGTFLLDSESRMDLAAAGMTAGFFAKDPVSGEEVSIRKAEKASLKSSYKGNAYYFASGENRTRFDREPGRYVKKP